MNLNRVILPRPIQVAALALAFAACTNDPAPRPEPRQDQPAEGYRYRAIAGVSMGGYGAGYLGFRYWKLFDGVGMMGGPVDWGHAMLDVMRNDILGGFWPQERENMFRYERLHYGVDVSPFDRENYLKLTQDLSLAFGNPVFYNPNSTYFAPGLDNSAATLAAHGIRQCGADGRPVTPHVVEPYYDREYNNPGDASPYCASYPGAIPAGADGVWPAITYCDGGGRNELPYAEFVSTDTPDYSPATLAVDCNGNGRRDSGEPVMRGGMAEPFLDIGTDGLADADEPGYSTGNPDPNGDNYAPTGNPLGTEKNLLYDEGEPYDDAGLDGIAGVTNLADDPFEGNGKFDYNPNIRRMLDHSPFELAKDVDFARVKVYGDGGVKDPFRMGEATERVFGQVLARDARGKVFHRFEQLIAEAGVPFPANDGDPSLYALDLDRLDLRHLMVLYGEPALTFEQAIAAGGSGGHVGTPREVLQRLAAMVQWGSWVWADALPDDPATPFHTPVAITMDFDSKVLGVKRPIGITLPPGYDDSGTRRYPVLYVLHGYGMDPEVMAQTGYVFELMMSLGIIRPMIVVYPNGRTIQERSGSFYVNRVDDNGIDPFCYEDHIVYELMPWVESTYRTLTDPKEIEAAYPQPAPHGANGCRL